MEKCFEELQDQIQELIKYRLDYFDEYESNFVFDNDDLSVELYMDVEYDGYEYRLKDLSFGYFESEVYPYDVLDENLYIICDNIIFYLS